MIARLTALCVVELVVVVLLAMQVFAAPERRSVPVTDREVDEASAPQESSSSSRIDPEAERPQDSVERAPAPAPTERQPVAARWKADDPVGVLLTGCVRDGDGNAIAAPNVYAARDGERRGGSGSGDGCYAITALSPGDWTVTIRAEGAADLEETLTITEAAVQEHDFVVVRSVPLRVLIVTPDGEDATRALRLRRMQFRDFMVAGQKDRFPERLAPTDYGAVFVGDAKWDREMNPVEGFAGTLRLQSAPPAHVALLQRHLVLEQQVVQPGQSEVKFVVDLDALAELAGSAVVRVVDAGTGAPIEGAWLQIGRPGGRGARSGADGTAIAEGLPPGFLRCGISAEGKEEMYTTVRIEPGKQLDLGEVRLGPALPLRGRIVDQDGQPVGGAQLSWAELKWLGDVRPFATNRSARSEADGRFELWRTGRGEIAVAARTREGLVACGIFQNPPPEPIELRLVEAAKCVITRPSDPSRSFVVLWFDERKRPIAAHALEDRRPEITVDLPPGTYGYEVRDDAGRPLQTGTLRLGATPTRLEVR